MIRNNSIHHALVRWLAGFDGFTVDQNITTDQLEATAVAYGLYKTPQATVVGFVDGSRDVVAYYRFLARQANNRERDRREGQDLLESFETWVRKRSLERDLPDLGENRECQYVRVANTFAMEEQDTNEAVYQLSLAINYIEE